MQFRVGRVDPFALAGPPGVGKQADPHPGEHAVRGGRRQPNRPGIAADVVLDVAADPTDRISGQAVAEPLRVEAADRGVQAQMAGADQIEQIDVEAAYRLAIATTSLLWLSHNSIMAACRLR